VRQTREHALGLFQEVGAITGSIKRAAGVALAAGIDTLSLLPATPEAAEERALAEAGAANAPFEAGAGIQAMESGYSIASGGGKRFKPFVVYNPCAWVRSEPVTVTLYDTDLDPGRIVARDETGASHPTLFLGRGRDWGHDKITVLFLARDVPALGYRTFILCEGVADVETPGVSALTQDRFETPFLSLKYDRFRSGFSEVVDKRNGACISWPTDYGLVKPLGAWEYALEQPRGMTAWVLGEEVDLPIPLKSSSYGTHGVARNQGTHYPVGNAFACAIRQTLEVPFTKSSVRLTTLVHGLEPRIDVIAEVDWREIGDEQRGIPGLAVRFPVDIDERSDLARYETPFGSVTRDLHDGQEVPTLRYAHVIGASSTEEDEEDVIAGFTLLQDCKYGHSFQNCDLRMRVIRSSFDPDHAPEVCRQTVQYSMYFHSEEPTPADLTRLGAAWNHPLVVFPANGQGGDGVTPAARSLARVETPNVVLTALKQAEDGDGLVLRLVEYDGQDVEAVVTLDPALTTGLRGATVLDLMERPVAGAAPASFDGTTLRVPVRANSFVTVRVG
jgi:alpha-mannosidase